MGSNTSNPQVTISLLPAALVDAFADRRDLVVGQIGVGGNAVDGDLYQDVQSLNKTEIKTLFGDDSELTYRIIEWIEANGGYSPLDVISKDPSGTAVKATATIVFANNATSAGSLTIQMVDGRQFDVTVSAVALDTPTIIGDALVTAIGNLTDPPFTAANVTGTVTLTATDGGTIGSFYAIDVAGSVPGVDVTVTGFASGANDPVLTGILDPIDGIRYTGIQWPEFWAADLDIVKDELDTRFNASNAILDGVAFHGRSATFANAKTAVSTLNSQSLVVGGTNVVTDASHSKAEIVRPADWVLSEFMGIRARRNTTDAPIADQIITTSGLLDAFGGPSLASLPYFNTPLRRTPVTPPANLFSNQEQLELEEAGYTTYGVNSSQNAMIMGPAVTTYTTDAGGNVNDSFHYLNFIDTGSACREIFFRTLKSVFSQSRLTEGTLIEGRSMANAESIKAELLRIYRVLAGLALTQAGREAESYFAQNTTVTIVLSQRKATISGPLTIVTQLGAINYSLHFDFSVGSTGVEITV